MKIQLDFVIIQNYLNLVKIRRKNDLKEFFHSKILFHTNSHKKVLYKMKSVNFLFTEKIMVFCFCVSKILNIDITQLVYSLSLS